MEPPRAPRRPVESVLHGVRRVDEYAWMRDASSPEVLEYLHAERRYYDARTAHSRPLQEALFSEMSLRTLPADSSVSWTRGGPVYYTRTVAGKEYPQFCLSDRDLGGERVLLDVNVAAAGADYAELGVCEPSPDGRRLAWSLDTDGDEVYALRVRDLEGGQDSEVLVERSYYTCAWSADSGTLFYTVTDAAYRPHQVWRHDVTAAGSGASDPDVLVLEEPDERYELTVRATRSRELILIEARSRDDSQTWWLSAGDPASAPRVLWPRRPGIEYAVDHLRGDAGTADPGEIIAVTNDGAPEFRVVRVPLADPGPAGWTDVLPSDPSTRWESVAVIGGYAVAAGRRDAEPFLHVVDLSSRPGIARGLDIHPETPVGRILLERNEDPDATGVTVQIDSLVAPPRWLEIDLATGARTVVKTLDVPTYDASSYVTQRIWATAPDGVHVPVTVARHVDTPLDGTAPCLLWGYGAYEACIWPDWDPAVVGLLDRGIVFAVAHVRGGGEGGRRWWEQGHRRAKHHTFSDFVACADALADGLVDGTRIVSRGLSAGGLLQGAALTLAPARWAGVIAEVPFVDVVTSMLDPTVPLTVTEWDEWGDPRDPDDFAAMIAYSPYDNPPAGPRPALLVTGSRHDPRVLVHEPAKWVARLRATAGPDDPAPLLFRVELGAGAHVGPAGRYGHLRYEAEVLAFALEAMGAAPGAGRTDTMDG